MKQLLFILIIGTALSGCNDSISEKEKYKSETLTINQISKHCYQHISYVEEAPFGKYSCNGMIVTGKNEAIVFDTPGDDASSAELIDFINTALKCKINAVIPTHTHTDNIGGLAEFHARGIPSYAYIGTINLAKENGLPVPQHSFNTSIELKVGNERVIIEYPGEGHTSDNSIGYFPSDRVLFGGCLIKEFGAAKGNLAEANVQAWPETVRKIKAKYPNVKKIIPGHGKTGDKELLDYTISLF